MDGESLAKVGRVGKEEAWWYFTLFAGISSHLAFYLAVFGGISSHLAFDLSVFCGILSHLAFYLAVFGGILSHLALYVHCHGVGELEGVEESVGDNGCPRVRSGNLHELADHLGTQDAAVLITQLDGLRILSVRRAGLHPHVKLACVHKRSSLGLIDTKKSRLVIIIVKLVSEW